MPGHPESPERLARINERLRESGLLDRLTAIPPLSDRAVVEQSVLRIHSADHFESVMECETTGETAFLAAAGALAAVDAVMRGTVNNAFCALRPPGHHAHNNGAHHDGLGQGQGFCFFNNVAIAARYAQQVHKCQRVLILDWDFHHGNGTEWAFYDDPTVFFFSTHALYAYPGTGFAERTGAGDGLGYNLNVPLGPGADDKDIKEAWQGHLMPRLNELGFKPDLVLVSAGFDSREGDHLGNFGITDDGFAALTKMAMAIAHEHCAGRLVSVLEGGYEPEGLASAVARHVGEMEDWGDGRLE